MASASAWPSRPPWRAGPTSSSSTSRRPASTTGARAALDGLLTGAAGRGALVVCADHVGLPAATRHLRVADGGVQWVAGQRPAPRMRVAGAGAVPSRDASGVVDVTHGADGSWVALVDAAYSDAFLASALAAGASVREVGPA